MISLADVFDAATVERLAGPVVQARGSAYLSDRRVEPAAVRAGRLEATVRGTVPYLVELWTDRGRPRWSCTCPAAEDGSFCKHCTAVALSLSVCGDRSGLAPAVGTGRSRDPASGERSESGTGAPTGLVGGSGRVAGATPLSSDTDDELADFVAGLAPDRLAAIVLDRAESDWRLRERLLAEAQADRGVGPDLAGWRRRIDSVLAARGFVTYSEAPGWAVEVHEVIDGLEDLCTAGHHDAAARLAEHAHRRADRAIEYVDDSDGWLSGFSSRLSELHLRACEAGRPDPVELADRLLELELTSELDGFHRCAASYADVLGETGLAAFRQGLEPRLERMSSKAGRWSSGAFAAEQALVGWALGTGDPDTLIEAHGRDRALPGDVLEIAQVLDRADRGDEAIAWARRGIAEWGSQPWQVGELRDYLARRLRDQGEEQAAVELFWQAFVSGPSFTAYRRLIEEDSHEDWLARCRAKLGQALVRVPRSNAGECWPGAAFGPLPPAVPETAAALVAILLYEGLVDDAWTAAHEYGCRAETWLTLARAREQSHPLDSIAVYEQAAVAIIERADAKRYQSAVDLIARVRRLGDSAGELARFVLLVERVRVEHKAKRKLKSLLDAQGW